jgi:hypothetical protein
VPPEQSTHVVHGKLEHLSATAPMAREFWIWLGLNYAAIDIDGSPESIPLDLNFDDVPREAKGKFHLVTNFGTTEHVANQLNAFKIIHELAAPRGIMIHHLPASGMVNHGLVNYNPKFFWMLARSNGYKWLHMDYYLWGDGYRLPKNIVDNVEPFKPDIVDRARNYRVVDGFITVAVQKIYDIPYVPPIDVPTDLKSDNKALRKRYWTVFTPGAFEGRLMAGSPARRLVDSVRMRSKLFLKFLGLRREIP